jgi:hypothetical protein
MIASRRPKPQPPSSRLGPGRWRKVIVRRELDDEFYVAHLSLTR